MKTKLLRKIRKRFEINYYPNGYDFGSGYETNAQCVVLIDKSFWNFRSSPIIYREFIGGNVTKEEAFEYCLYYLQDIIIEKYDSYGTRRNKESKKTTEKLWHVIK